MTDPDRLLEMIRKEPFTCVRPTALPSQWYHVGCLFRKTLGKIAKLDSLINQSFNSIALGSHFSGASSSSEMNFSASRAAMQPVPEFQLAYTNIVELGIQGGKTNLHW